MFATFFPLLCNSSKNFYCCRKEQTTSKQPTQWKGQLSLTLSCSLRQLMTVMLFILYVSHDRALEKKVRNIAHLWTRYFACHLVGGYQCKTYKGGCHGLSCNVSFLLFENLHLCGNLGQKNHRCGQRNCLTHSAISGAITKLKINENMLRPLPKLTICSFMRSKYNCLEQVLIVMKTRIQMFLPHW